MALKITNESHLDHGLSQKMVEELVRRFADRNGFFIETITVPPGEKLECGLYGPVMGDPPVPESEVEYVVRGGRKGPSRLVPWVKRPTNKLTVIAGPDGDDACVLYTAFGGPSAPREPWDPGLDEAGREESKKFWAEHALTREG